MIEHRGKQEKKTLVYPYDEEFLPFLRYWGEVQNYEVERLVSPRGWSYCNEIYSIRNKTFCVGTQFDADLQMCDAVWFVNARIELDFRQYILPKIKQAIAYNKKVIMSRRTNDEEWKLLNDYKKDLLAVPETRIQGNNDNYKDEIFDINVPVIFIVGLTEYTGKSLIQMDLWNELKKRGYHVAMISPRSEIQMFGGYTIPDDMYSGKLCERDKIMKFNHFVKQIEYAENPEVFLVNIPGELMPVSREFVGCFGSTAYEISQAVRPDCVIFSILFGEYSKKQLVQIGERAVCKMGCKIDYYNVADRLLDVARTKSEGRYVTIELDKGFVRDNMPMTDQDLFHLSEQKEVERMADSIIDQLSDNAFIRTL